MALRIPRREDATRLLILAGVWTGLFLVVDPRGQFPLNDDFQYAETARRFLAGEGVHLPEWALSSTVSHALLGAVMTAPWGASNQALRMWMLVMGLIGAAVVYALARRWKASPDAALLAGLTLALSPLYATMSASFHLDVTTAVFMTAGLGAFLRGRERGSMGWLAASSALIALSGLSRQTSFFCAAGAAASLALDRKLTIRSAAALLLPAGLAAAAFLGWVRFIHGPTWAWECGRYVSTTAMSYWLRPNVWDAILERVSDSIQMSALCLAPLAAVRLRDSFRRRPARPEAAILALVIGAGIIGFLFNGGLPLIENTLSRAGLGAVTLNAADEKVSGWWESPWLWQLLGLIALLSSWVLTRAVVEEARGPRAGELRAAALFVGAPYAAMLFMPALYDRYLLTLLPAAAAAFAAGRQERAGKLVPGFVVLALLGGFTAAGLTDYFAWNRARWAAGMEAVAHGVPPDKVENGFDWDGQFSLTRNMAKLKAAKPAREIGVWDWQGLNRVVAATTFSRTPTLDGWVSLNVYRYRTPLAPGGGEVRLDGDPKALRLVLPVEPVRR